MNIKDIIAKLQKGEKLTDDEQAFVDKFDLQAELDKASAAARRKAEADTKAEKTKAAELQAKIDELTAQLEEKATASKTQETELAKLTKQVAKLTEANAKAEADKAAYARMDAIREAAKANGIAAADGISAKAFEKLLDLAVGTTDHSDAEAMKGVLEQFKQDNPTMIRAAVKEGANVKGKPNANPFAGQPNPWKPESFNLTKCLEIETANPEVAKQMKAEAGVADTSAAPQS